MYPNYPQQSKVSVIPLYTLTALNRKRSIPGLHRLPY